MVKKENKSYNLQLSVVVQRNANHKKTSVPSYYLWGKCTLFWGTLWLVSFDGRYCCFGNSELLVHGLQQKKGLLGWVVGCRRRFLLSTCTYQSRFIPYATTQELRGCAHRHVTACWCEDISGINLSLYGDQSTSVSI